MYGPGQLSAQVRHSCSCWNQWRKGLYTVISQSLFIVLCPAPTVSQVHVWQRLNKDKLEADLRGVLASGIKSLAVVLLHSYT